MQGPTVLIGMCLIRAWVPTESSLVTLGGGWVVLCQGLKLSTKCVGSGIFQEVQEKVSH